MHFETKIKHTCILHHRVFFQKHNLLRICPHSVVQLCHCHVADRRNSYLLHRIQEQDQHRLCHYRLLQSMNTRDDKQFCISSR